MRFQEEETEKGRGSERKRKRKREEEEDSRRWRSGGEAWTKKKERLR